MLPAINQSQLKAWRNCQQMWKYKYEDRLAPKGKVRPLFLGSWVHAALESYYKDGDWKVGHREYVQQYNALKEEERVELETKRGRRGRPLPELVTQIMKSYVWYYRNDEWEVVLTEEVFDVELKGVRFKGRIDLIIKDGRGLLWVIDHKTASQIPMATAFHAMDPQLFIYPWAAKKQWGMDIAGVMFNYVKSKPPSIPKLTKSGYLSRRKIVTDYPTLMRFLKENEFDPHDFTDILKPLMKKSEFLRRYKLPREETVLKRILQEALWTGREIMDHPHTVRNITRDCVRCPYKSICQAELNGFDTTLMRRNDFVIEEDPYGSVDLTEQTQDEAED
jgi:RecB family exonuclease